MRIDHIALERYGHFNDQTITFPRSDTDLHLIVGENEAGKSTLRQAISDWLWGIPKNSGMTFRFPGPQLRVSGKISEAERELVFARTKGLKDTLRDATDHPLSPAALNTFLAGVGDRDYFERMFCLNHARLREGGDALLDASSGDRWAQMLFQSASGIGGLDALQRRLEEEAETLWGGRAKQGRAYDDAFRAFEAARKAVYEAEVRFKTFDEHRRALDEARQKVNEIASQLQTLRSDKGRLIRVRSLAPQFDERALSLTQRAEIGELPFFPEGASERIAKALSAIAGHMQAKEKAEAELAEIQNGLSDIRLHEKVEEAEAAIEKLVRKIEQVEQARKDQIGVSADQTRAKDEAQRTASGLSWAESDVAGLRARLAPEPARRAATSLLAEIATNAQERESEKLKLDAAEKAIADNEREFSQCPEVSRLEELKRATDDLRAALAVHTRRAVIEATEKLDRTLRKIPGFVGDVATLRALILPSREQARAAEDARTQAQVRIDALRQQATAAEERLRAANESRRRQQEHAGDLGEEALAAHRDLRDNLWRAIRAGERTVQLDGDAFESAIVSADQLSDRRYEEADKVHQLDSARREAKFATDHLASLSSAIFEHEKQRDRATTAWAETLAKAGLHPMNAADLEDWRTLREKALDTGDALAEAMSASTAADANVEGAVTAVKESLMGEISEEITPKALLAIGDEQHKRQSNDEVQRKLLLRQREKLNASAAPIRAKHEQLRSKAEELSQRWQMLAREARLDPGLDPALAIQYLSAMDKLDDQLAARDGYAIRFKQMEDTIATFGLDVRSLAIQLGIETAERDPVDLCNELDRLVAEQKVNRKRRDDRNAELARQQANCRSAIDGISSLRTDLTPLLSLAKTDDVEQLLRVALDCDNARKLEVALAAGRANIVTAGQGLSFEEICREFDSEDKATIEARIASFEEQEQRLHEEGVAAGGKRQAAEAEYNRHGGSDAAAAAEVDRQLALSTMKDAMERYVAAKAGAVILRWTLNRYRQQAQGPMLSAASQYFSLLTDKRYSGLVVDPDSEKPTLLAELAESGQQITKEALSEGTRDPMYLALRLAAIEIHLKEHPGMIMIADDLFINMDDVRAACGFRALAELSKKAQVLYLTHHDHLEAVARNSVKGLNVVRLRRDASTAAPI